MNLRTERQLRDELSRVWSMLETERAASKWQPIETATKANGNRILVWDADNEIAATAQWDEFRKRWSTDDYDTPNTTHWMPLPAPPAGA